MSTVKLLPYVTCSLLCFFAGCGGATGRYETVEQVCAPGVGKQDVMQAADKVLGQMHFTIAKYDLESGYMRSRPLAAAQFFEFWSKDTAGAFNSAEANMHSIRRTVELDITRQGDRVCIGCDVKVERLSLSDYSVADGQVKYDKHSDTGTRVSTQSLELGQKRKVWIDLGDDQKLATVILKRIEKQLVTLRKKL